MPEEKNEKDASCDTCNQTSPIVQQKKESQAQGSLNSRLSLIKHRLGCRIIPEWIERWALGD